jgi:ketosteroid isomerase-like protein
MVRPALIRVLPFVSMVGCQGGSAQFTDEDRQTNQAITDTFVRHLLAKQSDSLAALYSTDGMIMPPGQGIVAGHDAIRQWQANFPPVARFEATNDAIEGNDEIAYVRGRYVLQIQGAPVDSGKYVEVRRRQADGSWKIVIDIFNSSVPVSAPAAPAPAPGGTKSR